MRLRGWIVVAGVVLTSGCATTARYQKISSGKVGCPPGEIAISDDHFNLEVATWTATCRGKVFHCSSTSAFDTTCSPEPDEE